MTVPLYIPMEEMIVMTEKEFDDYLDTLILQDELSIDSSTRLGDFI